MPLRRLVQCFVVIASLAAGFEPVSVRTLAESRIFDLGAPAGGAPTAAELRKILGH